MKKLLRIAAIAFAGLLAVLLLGGLLLPREWQVQRQAVVPADREVVFPLLSTVDGLKSWNDLSEGDPTFRVVDMPGPREGVGASYAWESEGAGGSGSLTITDATPPDRVAFDLRFGDFDLAGTWELTAVDGGTRVTWTETADIANPALRWLAPLSKGMVEADFDQGLARLGRAAEALAEVQPESTRGAAAPSYEGF